MKVDFATFCYAGDAHRLHTPGQFKRQVESNNHFFDICHVVYQGIDPTKYDLESVGCPIFRHTIYDVNWSLQRNGIDIHKKQYVSSVDKSHAWKVHVVNHIVAIEACSADYIVFADSDCWMINQPKGKSWISEGIEALKENPHIFIVSPNDGEQKRLTSRFSQQMFLARVKEFRSANFNQPGWDGDVNVPDGPLPEYWGMLEGRMELHCRMTGQYRYVLGPEYRYWHHNRLNENDLFETDLRKY